MKYPGTPHTLDKKPSGLDKKPSSNLSYRTRNPHHTLDTQPSGHHTCHNSRCILHPRQAKISDFDEQFWATGAVDSSHQEVSRLEITVNDAQGVEVGHALANPLQMGSEVWSSPTTRGEV